MGIHEKQKQDCETSSVLAVLYWENATYQSEENKHSLAIGVKDVTDFLLFFFNLNCGSLLKLLTNNSNEIKMCILYVGIYTYIKISLKKKFIGKIFLF